MKYTKKWLTNELNDLLHSATSREGRPEDILLELRDLMEKCDKRNERPELWDNYKTSDEVEEMAREALDSWLNRLSCFFWDVDFRNISIMYVDNYWNCDNRIWYPQLADLIKSIIKGL